MFGNVSRRKAIGLAVGAMAALSISSLTDIFGPADVSLGANRPPFDGEERMARDMPGSTSYFEINVDGEWKTAYCMDVNWGNPANNSPYVCAGWATGGLGYIVAHGYDGVLATSGYGRLVTNLAVWCLMVDGPGTVRSADGIASGLSVSAANAEAAHTLLSDAVAFHNDPSRNVASAPENHAGTVWIPKNLPSGWPYSNPVSDRTISRGSNTSWTQRMLVPTKESYGHLMVRKRFEF